METTKVTSGIILARLQPIHNGHVELIKKSVSENTNTIIFIGSADKFNERNPIPISLRLQLTKDAISQCIEIPEDKYVAVLPLDDLDDESNNSHEWGFYLYSKIVSVIGSANFTMYYSDGFEIITTWFPGFILRNNVSLSLVARNSVESGISATRVRDMILRSDPELEKYVPGCVFELRETLRKHIELSKLVK